MNWLGIIQSVLDIPFVAQLTKDTLHWVDYIWLGHTSSHVCDEIVPVWHTKIRDAHMETEIVNYPVVPQFHPYSLKYAYLLTGLYCSKLGINFLTKEQLELVSTWTPFIPRVFNDVFIVYYTRKVQWLYMADSEIEWLECCESLKNWISEHKGKESSDATWEILSIYTQKQDEEMNDVTNLLFSFMGPSGDFLHKGHLRRLTKLDVTLETIEGDRIEI